MIRINPTKIRVFINNFLIKGLTLNSLMTINDVSKAAGTIRIAFWWIWSVSKEYVENIPKAKLEFRKSKIILTIL